MTNIEFATLTSDDLKPYIWDFRDFVIDRLPSTDESYGLEDFIYGLDFASPSAYFATDR